MPPDPYPPPAAADRQLALLDQALRQTRWNLGLSVLLLLGYLAAVAYTVYFVQYGARKKEEQALAAVRQRLVQDIKPLTEEVGDMAADVTPPVANAFFNQLAEDLPNLTSEAEQQGQHLADHLEATLEEGLMARYRAERPKYEAVLRKEFPEITDQATYDNMMNQFEAAYRKLIRRYHLKEYRRRVAQTAKLWKEIPPASRDDTKALATHLSDDLRQWVRIKLVESGVRPAEKEDRR